MAVNFCKSLLECVAAIKKDFHIIRIVQVLH
jgi:hypothetical protein